MLDVEGARGAIERFFAALNAHDGAGQRDALHYPHVRFAGDRVRVWETPEDFPLPSQRLAEAEPWHHSGIDRLEPVQAGEDKVHFALRFTRYREDGSAYASYDTLWIVTRRVGRWGVQGRSSFAP